MEAFASTDDRGWRIIERLIDQTDYCVLILAGRYGSFDEDVRMSWTHREYRYAREQGIPVLVFKRSDTHIARSVMETDPAQQERLSCFLAEVAENHKWAEWTTAEDLTRKVSFSLKAAIEDDQEDGQSRPGWYRGGEIRSELISLEFPAQAPPEVSQSIQRALQNAGISLHHGRTLRVISPMGTVGYRGLGADGKSLAIYHASGPCTGTTFTARLGFGYVLCTRWLRLEPILGFPISDDYSTHQGSRADFEGGRLEWVAELEEVHVYSDIVDGGRLVSKVKLE